jgi:hypothetical protein
VASSAFDPDPGCSWLDDASNVVFAATEPPVDTVSLPAGGKT